MTLFFTRAFIGLFIALCLSGNLISDDGDSATVDVSPVLTLKTFDGTNLRCVLTNTSRRDILYLETFPRGIEGLEFNLTKDGESAGTRESIRKAYDEKHLVRLPPGKSVKFNLDLKNTFGIVSPGLYRLDVRARGADVGVGDTPFILQKTLLWIEVDREAK